MSFYKNAINSNKKSEKTLIFYFKKIDIFEKRKRKDINFSH